jgi:hypothetical protein
MIATLEPTTAELTAYLHRLEDYRRTLAQEMKDIDAEVLHLRDELHLNDIMRVRQTRLVPA